MRKVNNNLFMSICGCCKTSFPHLSPQLNNLFNTYEQYIPNHTRRRTWFLLVRPRCPERTQISHSHFTATLFRGSNDWQFVDIQMHTYIQNLIAPTFVSNAWKQESKLRLMQRHGEEAKFHKMHSNDIWTLRAKSWGNMSNTRTYYLIIFCIPFVCIYSIAAGCHNHTLNFLEWLSDRVQGYCFSLSTKLHLFS